MKNNIYKSKDKIVHADKNGKKSTYYKSLFDSNKYTNYQGKEIKKNIFNDGFELKDKKTGYKEKFHQGIFSDYVGNKGTKINNNKIYSSVSPTSNSSSGSIFEGGFGLVMAMIGAAIMIPVCLLCSGGIIGLVSILLMFAVVIFEFRQKSFSQYQIVAICNPLLTALQMLYLFSIFSLNTGGDMGLPKMISFFIIPILIFVKALWNLEYSKNSSWIIWANDIIHGILQFFIWLNTVSNYAGWSIIFCISILVSFATVIFNKKYEKN